jgi:hypothetical protein
MTRRTFAAMLFLFPCLLFVRPMPAGGQPDKPKPPPAQKPSLASVERGLAELEAKLAQMTKEVQSLRGDLKGLARTPEFPNIKLIALKNMEGTQLARTLQEFVGAKEGKSLRIVCDQQTNSLLLQGDDNELFVVEAIIGKLENQAAAKPAAKQNGEEKPR